MQRDTGPSLTSFVFVGDHYVLIGKHEFTDDRTKDAAIYLVDLTAQSRQWKFGFPAMATPDAVEAFEVLCEPGSSWRPPQAHAVPFYVSQEERLIIVKINLSSFVCVSFAMLSSSLLSIAREACTSNEGIQEIPWREWGYKHCSASLRTQWDSIWPCVVYGTKQVDTRVRNPSFRGTEYDVLIEDFNQLDLRHTLSGPPPEHQSRSDWCVEPITFEPDYRVGLNAFAEPFTTSLMYREVSAPCELKYGDVLMISEDSIVVVKVCVCRLNEPNADLCRCPCRTSLTTATTLSFTCTLCDAWKFGECTRIQACSDYVGAKTMACMMRSASCALCDKCGKNK